MSHYGRHWFYFAMIALAEVSLSVSAADTSFATIERGRYLVTAGDCTACHTTDGGKSFAGGRAIETPFGVIYSPNLTPDTETGIGNWNDEDFYTALHSGVAPDGTRLYPAFPYPYFTQIARDDAEAMRAFLATLEPVKYARPANELKWPFNERSLLRVWNRLYLDKGAFKAQTGKSDEWNRGAYLVRGLAHCGACHTPTNFAGAPKRSRRLEGGRLQDWFAPNLTNEVRFGIGDWEIDDVIEYLKTGRNRYSGATGLMGEVVSNSTSKLEARDLRAIAVYLKDAPLTDDQRRKAAKADQLADAGKAIYADSCSACHQIDGTGVPHMFPPLADNANTQSTDATTVVRVILQGARTVPTEPRPTPSSMPAFDWKLTDAQTAAVATYVRNAWGNSAPPVNADQVRSLRAALKVRAH